MDFLSWSWLTCTLILATPTYSYFPGINSFVEHKQNALIFSLSRPELELASTLGSSTKLRSIRRLAFIWPTKPGGGNGNKSASFQFLWPEPPLRRENYPNPKYVILARNRSIDSQ